MIRITLYSIYVDILANPEDADHIRNITQDFLNTDRLDALTAMNISPVTFAVHTDNKTPGIDSNLGVSSILIKHDICEYKFWKMTPPTKFTRTSHKTYSISLSSFQCI